MLDQKKLRAVGAAGSLGDLESLEEQLGSSAELAHESASLAFLQFQQVTTLPELQSFLRHYQAQVLIPFELPAIYRAFGHANRYEVRELILLDQQMQLEPGLRQFASASRHIGQSQLRRLRPMRDQRLIHRYGSAILSGDAQGFHTLVYGLILSLYSLPLRQGMLHYAYNTMRGFIHCAAGPLQLQPPTSESLLAEAFAAVPPALEILLEANGERSLQL